MTQKVYGLICDAGDGSSYMNWFRDVTVVERLLDDDNHEYVESYSCNEGSVAVVFEFPAKLDLEACGFSFYDDIFGDELLESFDEDIDDADDARDTL